MATAPSKYIDNIRIGTGTENSAQIAAPYIVGKTEKDGTPISDPANYKFKQYWETDYTKEISITTAAVKWEVNYDSIDKDTPSVTILDTDRNIIYAEVKYDKGNKKIIVDFNGTAVAGYILIN